MELIQQKGELGGGKGGWIEGIVILAHCQFHFLRYHENLEQHPSNNISIVLSLIMSYPLANMEK